MNKSLDGYNNASQIKNQINNTERKYSLLVAMPTGPAFRAPSLVAMPTGDGLHGQKLYCVTKAQFIHGFYRCMGSVTRSLHQINSSTRYPDT
jgi:hypothetical protein